MPLLFAPTRGQSVQPWAILALAVLLSFLLMINSNTTGMNLARSRAAKVLSILGTPFNTLAEYVNLKAENVRLRAENAQLMILSHSSNEAVRENERLRKLLGFKEQSHFNLKAAEIIAKSPMQGVQSLLIDAGQKDSIEKHMAVVSDQGLVGKIVRVFPTASVIQLLKDRNLGAAVRLAESRADGITASIHGNYLAIENIPSTANVRLGEKVLTSGLDDIFPAGIPVGKVVHIEKQEESLFLKVEIETAVDFTTLEEVFIVEGYGSRLP